MSAGTPPAGLYGRAEEIRVLSEALDALAAGRSAITLVEGEAGIGKTRLLAETLGQAGRRGFQVASGRAEELERSRPFGLVADALRCTRSSSDPRRAAIATLLAMDGGEQGPITVTSDPAFSSARSTPLWTWSRNWPCEHHWSSASTICSGPTRPAS
jgi:hypothetical protein